MITFYDQSILIRAEIGKPVDIGWGMATINADSTVTRQCKDCGVSVTSPYRLVGLVIEVEPRPLRHGSACRVADSIDSAARN